MSDYDDVMSANMPQYNTPYIVRASGKYVALGERLMTPAFARELAKSLEQIAYEAENRIQCTCGNWIVPARKKKNA